MGHFVVWHQGVGGSVGVGFYRALAKGDEATHSPKSCETKGSCKLLAPLKRISTILSSSRVSQEKGIRRATQGKRVVCTGVSGGTAEGGVGLNTQLKDYATPLQSRCAPFCQLKTPSGHDMRMNKAVQMT